jgi:hypothetical protein
MLGLAFDRQGDFVIVFGNVTGVDVDLDVDRRLLLLRRQRSRRIRVFKRQVLGVLRQHVQLRRRGRLGRRAIAVGHTNFSWSDLASGAAWHIRFRLKGKQKALSGRVAIIGLPLSTRMTVKADRESGPICSITPGREQEAALND